MNDSPSRLPRTAAACALSMLTGCNFAPHYERPKTQPTET